MAGNDVEIVVSVRDLASAGLARIGAAANLLGRTGRGAGSALGALIKPLGALGAAGGAVQTVSGLAGALTNIVPIALALPGALMAGAAAMATFKVATEGMGEALSAADPAAFAEATKDMPPAMRAAAGAMRDVKSQFGEVQKLVQANFWKDMATPIRELGGKYMPVLRQQLPAISAQFNLMGRGITEAFSRSDAISDVNSILGGTANALKGMGPALGTFGTALAKLGAFGVKQLAGLGEGVDGLATKFSDWVSKGVESGSFQEAFDRAKVELKNLGAIAGNIGGIIKSIFTGLGADFQSPLGALRETTAALRTFFESAAAQGPLQALGETLGVVAGVLKDVLLAGLAALAPIVEKLAPLLSTLAEVVGGILVTAFDQLGPPLLRLIDRLVPVLQPALEAIGTIIETIVIPALAALIDWLAGPGLDAIFSFAQGLALGMTDALIDVLTFTGGFLGALASVVNALALIPGPHQAAFGAAGQAIGAATEKINGFKSTMETVRSKQVELILKSEAEVQARRIKESIEAIRGKTVTVTIDQRLGAVVRGGGGFMPERSLASGGITSGGTALVGERGPELVRGAAQGGIGGGLKLVGERGAELVRLPGGSTVIPTGQSQRMLGQGGGGGGTVNVVLSASSAADSQFASFLMGLVRTGVLQLRAA